MANTTNYNWETPDDTDLVKDGAAAIRTLGSSIDTTTKNLNPETTTGDIAYRSATANTNTRLAIGTTGQVLTVAAGVPSWATPTTGDIEGVTAGTGISGGGTSGTVTVTNSMATAIDAKGDLIGGTGADTFARLAVGANDTVLTADSSTATGLKWAAPAAGGGMTLLSTTTLDGATVTISSISGSYKTLYAVIFGVTNASFAGTFRIAPNGETALTDCSQQNVGSTSTWASQQSGYLLLSPTTSDNRSVHNNTSNVWAVTINNYASTSSQKPFQVYGGFTDVNTGTRAFYSFGNIRTTSAISSLVFSNNAGNLTAGTVLLYGVN